MELSKVREGDEIECNVRGRVFTALVEEKLPGREGLRITPVETRHNYFKVTATQVTKVVRRDRK